MPGFIDRAKVAWDVLNSKIPDMTLEASIPSFQESYVNAWRDSQASVLAPIKTRIAIDASSVPIRHVIVDGDDRYKDTKRGHLDDRFNLKANIDQTGRDLVKDLVMTMLEDGAAAIVPVVTSTSAVDSTSYDILDMRVGRVLEWYNKSVKLHVYNVAVGQRVEVTLPKTYVAMCYNPLYSIMNEPNSTLKRLIDKLALLDVADSKINSPNLDMILHLPYALRGSKKSAEADARLAALVSQLQNSNYGMAYVDATEKITQLNRPVTNSLQEQVLYLEAKLHAQLGLSEAVFNGTADSEEMLGYYNRTIRPILDSITDSVKNSFLTKTAISQGQSIMAFQDLFKMAPVEVLAEAADKFTRNEIMTSNEVRSALGLKPSSDPGADELRNKNLNKEAPMDEQTKAPEPREED